MGTGPRIKVSSDRLEKSGIKPPTALGHMAQSVTCLTADPRVVSSIQAWSHTFVEIDHEIISTAILLPSTDSRRVVVSYKRKYVYKVLFNRLVKLAQEKSVVRWTDRSDMTRAVDWDVKHQTIFVWNCFMIDLHESMRPGRSNSLPLDLQSDSQLFPDMLPPALRIKPNLQPLITRQVVYPLHHNSSCRQDKG